MSKPFDYKSDFINGAMLEIISGRSALNMPPEPIPEEDQEPNNGYLSETDGMVKHSMEHFCQAYSLLIKENERQSKILSKMYRTIQNTKATDKGEITKEYMIDVLWKMYFYFRDEDEDENENK